MPKEGNIEGRGPEFEREDIDGDDFVNQNDKLRKTYVTPENVQSGARDFSNSINVSKRARLAKEADELLEASDKELDTVRKDIQNYTYIQNGSVVSKMDSFHVNHENETVTEVYGPGVDTSKRINPELVEFEGAPHEESFADSQRKDDIKIGHQYIKKPRKDYVDGYSHDGDNMKTILKNTNKGERMSRGVLREVKENAMVDKLKGFISKIWNKN